MDLLSGGDLRFHMRNKKNFTEEQTRKNKKIKFSLGFFIACLISGLEHIH